MAIVVVELEHRRQSNNDALNPSATLVFSASGLSDTPSGDPDADARAAVLAEAPTDYDSMPRQDITLKGVGHLVWEAEVVYAFGTEERQAEPEVGAPTTTFDIGGATVRITQSLETIDSVAASGGTPPDFGGAINVTEDSVEGVDITVPEGTFTETHIIANGSMTSAYRRKLTGLFGAVNDDVFRGYNAGEVQYRGASGFQRVGGDWEITFRFAVSLNQTAIAIGDLDPIDKLGWHYLWVRYEKAEDSPSNSIVQIPVAAYVERLFPEVDLATELGI